MQKSSEKVKITADTSALISLSIGSTITDCLDMFEVVISPRVEKELEDTSKYKDKHAKGAEDIIELISEGSIIRKEFDEDKTISKLIYEYQKLDWGETETLLMAERYSIPIMITDDFKSLGSLKKIAKDTKIYLSIYTITRLVIEGIISKERAEDTLENIAKERSWEGAAIYRFAKGYLKDL